MDGRAALADMALFATVVSQGSFTKAARALDMPKSSLSRRISELEGKLGVALLTRTSRAMSPTGAGARFFEHCARVVEEAEEARRALVRAANTAEGTVRITAPAAFGALYLGPICAEVLDEHPGLTLEVVLSNRMVDLVEEGFDLAIRLGKKLPESSLVARRVGRARRVLCASPDYLRKAGAPRAESDLADHHFLIQGESGRPASWSIAGSPGEAAVPLRGKLWSNHAAVLRDAALAGLGIACIPVPIVRADLAAGRLEQVLPDVVPPELDVFVVVPSNRHMPARVRTFVDVLVPRLSEQMERSGRK